jgi:Mg2+ and Co2+ transporter CorA
MLRSEFRFSTERGPQRALAVLLGESFLGFLAIVAVALTLFPMLFRVKPGVNAGIDTVQWIIIGWFAVEFVLAFASSRAKLAFLRSPWRWLDLATILIPLASLLPTVSHALLSSPVLRLIRLGRLVTLGVRVSGIAVRHTTRRPTDNWVVGPAQVFLMADAPEFSPAAASWEELLGWLKRPGQEWFHVSNPSREQLAQIAAVAGLPAGFLEGHLLGTNYPHVAPARNFTGIFLWMPEQDASGQVQRHGVLFVLSAQSLLSLARGPTKAIEKITAPLVAAAEEGADETPFPVRLLGHVLERVIQQNEVLVGGFEQELRALEDIPIRDSSPAFFERTFRTKKELSATQADLWRLKGVLTELADGRGLPAKSEAAHEIFRRLANSAEYLYETVVNIRDEVLAVMELHLNIVSFDMNRVMRVLAVVSVLGLIPAVIGGLFGMNLIDNPWPFTLPQVAFSICFGMVLCLYFFFVKGWLR